MRPHGGVHEDGEVRGWATADFGYQGFRQHLLGCLLPSVVRTCHPWGKVVIHSGTFGISLVLAGPMEHSGPPADDPEVGLHPGRFVGSFVQS